jgi:mRNA-degrading endonuclease RelE of RelBE toxin-antitoxin system
MGGSQSSVLSRQSLYMWNDRLRIAECVLPQWRSLNDAERDAVRKALETIDEDPIIGAPLFDPLRGYWSFHADGLRIIYRIVAEARFVVILSITRR